MTRREGQVVTFYSYKGGTGRTMALANVAWILAANGKRVLVVDWDLESPGLHRFFAPFIDRDALAEHRRRDRPDPGVRVGDHRAGSDEPAPDALARAVRPGPASTRSRWTGTSPAAARSTSSPPAGRTATTRPLSPG